MPTAMPAGHPTHSPTAQPTRQPTSNPTNPTGQPSSAPSNPTGQPTGQPSSIPSNRPTAMPTTHVRAKAFLRVSQKISGLSVDRFQSSPALQTAFVSAVCRCMRPMPNCVEEFEMLQVAAVPTAEAAEAKLEDAQQRRLVVSVVQIDYALVFEAQIEDKSVVGAAQKNLLLSAMASGKMQKLFAEYVATPADRAVVLQWRWIAPTIFDATFTRFMIVATAFPSFAPTSAPTIVGQNRASMGAIMASVAVFIVLVVGLYRARIRHLKEVAMVGENSLSFATETQAARFWKGAVMPAMRSRRVMPGAGDARPLPEILAEAHRVILARRARDYNLRLIFQLQNRRRVAPSSDSDKVAIQLDVSSSDTDEDDDGDEGLETQAAFEMRRDAMLLARREQARERDERLERAIQEDLGIIRPRPAAAIANDDQGQFSLRLPTFANDEN